jgi:hypothetical protein
VEDEEAEVEVDDGVEEKAEAELKALLVRQSWLTLYPSNAASYS